MNCSGALRLFPDLLLFLANSSANRGLAVHGDPQCIVLWRKSAGNAFVFADGLPGSRGLDSRLVHAFFPGFYTLGIVNNSVQTAENLVVAEDELRSAQIAALDEVAEKWVVNGWGFKRSLLRKSMSGVTVTIAIISKAEVNTTEAVRRFATSLGALYWSALVSHYKFKIRYQIIRRPEGDASFNSVRFTMDRFAKSSADAISDLFLISTERVEKMNFILVGLEVKYHFIIRRPEYEYSWLAVVRPLAPSLWWGVLAMIPGIGFGIWFVFRRDPGSNYRVNLPASVFLAFGICCSQVKLSALRTGYMKCAVLLALNFFYQIQQFYVSNLYSMLATREIIYPFSTIEEFIDRKTHQFAISPDTSVYSAFQAAENRVFRRVWEQFMENDPGHVINETNMDQVVERVCQGTTALFALPLQVAGYSTDRCPLLAIPEGYFPNDMAIATSKNFSYGPHFNALFLRMMEAGISNYLKKKYVMSIMPGMKKTDLAVDPVPVSLYQVLFVFAILIISALISVLFLIFENLVYRTSEKKGKLN